MNSRNGFGDLLARAAARVRKLAGRLPVPAQAPVVLPPFEPAAARAANGQLLSRAVVALIEQAVREAAAAPSFGAALEIGYRAFGAVACTPAAREGISAFQQRRSADFSTTG
jgi:enoyl-CoA hydratase/3-hydroxyacyl-CoA dehydrogenase